MDILIVPVHMHEIFVYLFVSSIPFIKVLIFSGHRSLTFLILFLDILLLLLLFCLFFFLGPHPRPMEVPKLGVKLELQLLAYATAKPTRDLNHICDLHHSSLQCQIPDPLSKARDHTRILMDTSQIPFCCTTGELPILFNAIVNRIVFLASFSDGLLLVHGNNRF